MDKNWINVKDRLPECDMTPNSFGVAVDVKPRFGVDNEQEAFYGCRQTDDPNFYKYGAVIEGVTHWRYREVPND